jgi:hypothetical protein
MNIAAYYNNAMAIYRVRIGEDMFDMSSDAHLPNGYCQYAGRFSDFHPADYVGVANELPIGIVRAITRIATGQALASLREMVDMFEKHVTGAPGPNDAAARWDRAREVLDAGY